jgi:hypothetical protein
LIARHRDHITRPAGRGADRPHPGGLRERIRLCHVVDAAGRAPVADGQSDRVGDVLDVAARPPPTRDSLLEQDGGTPVVHPPQVERDAVLVVARTVDDGESQHRPGQPWLAEHDTFDVDLLVVVEAAAVAAIGVEPLAQ